MSALPEPLRAEPCPICGTVPAAADERCPACHCDLAGIGDRPSPWSKMTIAWMIAAFLVVYGVVVLVVALTN